MGWTFGPLPQVGSPVGYLKTTPTGLDSATKIGCKAQSYTSWDCVSRLYVGGVFIAEQPNSDAPIRTRRDTNILGDTPTAEERAQMAPAQKILLDKGLKIFVRGHGVLTQTQAARLPLEAATLTTSKVAAAGSKPTTSGKPIAGPSVQTRSMTDDNTGYYYSDILPVRSVSVSTMTCQRETDPMPYSPQYQILAGRLNDPAQTGVLSAVVRGPNVRDATTMSSLVKALALRPSTRYEIAAMLRCGCMGLSVGEESFFTDPIPYRFVRKPTAVSGVGMDILQKPGINPNSWRALAMPLDTFVALANNSYYSNTPEDFTYGGLDVTWTAVPVPSRLLGQSHLVAYVMSFLSSDSWSGTVNYKTITHRKGPADKEYQMNETYIPVVNSVDIPGVKNVCFVLIDETSPNCPSDIKVSLRDVTVTVPVWKGSTVVALVTVWPLWDKFWNKINLPGIRRDTVLAFSEICTRLGVSDACGTALSLLSELYGQWYGGIAPPTSGDRPTPDYSQAAYGA
ncbi:peroxidase 12 [Lasius niger]|uniref:Peroxidase 12 n=1 Tax=Lasius niger TaxID=67767 RepID=A0A0J7KT38_LASNI|nr:peroxidase 12 [Lasius niger]